MPIELPISSSLRKPGLFQSYVAIEKVMLPIAAKLLEFSLNVFTEFSEFSDKKYLSLQ